MDTALPQKFPFILDRNLAKANCTENRVCTSCDTVVLDRNIFSCAFSRPVRSFYCIFLSSQFSGGYKRIDLY